MWRKEGRLGRRKEQGKEGGRGGKGGREEQGKEGGREARPEEMRMGQGGRKRTEDYTRTWRKVTQWAMPESLRHCPGLLRSVLCFQLLQTLEEDILHLSSHMA